MLQIEKWLERMLKNTPLPSPPRTPEGTAESGPTQGLHMLAMEK
jgi:hypothetical protein